MLTGPMLAVVVTLGVVALLLVVVFGLAMMAASSEAQGAAGARAETVREEMRARALRRDDA